MSKPKWISVADKLPPVGPETARFLNIPFKRTSRLWFKNGPYAWLWEAGLVATDNGPVLTNPFNPLIRMHTTHWLGYDYDEAMASKSIGIKETPE